MGLYTLNVTDEDAKEGDAVGFFQTVDATTQVCSVPKGPTYYLRHGKFPQVFFGDKPTSVSGWPSCTGSCTSTDINMCFSCISAGATSNPH